MKRPFAVFDIDGTLARWSFYSSIVDYLIDTHALAGQAYEHIKETHDQWKQRASEGSYSVYESAVIGAWSQLQQEITYSSFLEATEAVFEAQKDHNYIYTRKLITELRSQGYFLIAISGSHQEVIDLITSYHGFDLGLGSQYLTKDDQYTGEEIKPVHDKGKALKEIIEQYNLDTSNSVGVGDSASDIAILELVSRPIAFNPEKTLRDKAIENKWPIIIERKNCTYSLNPTNYGYQLEI